MKSNRCRRIRIAKRGRVAAIVAAGLTLLVFRASPVFAATPPGNDDFTAATVITASPFTDSVDTTAATAASDDPQSCGFFGSATHTVWYSITPTVDEAITVNPSGSSYSPTVSAYSGARGALTQVACGTGPFAPIAWSATAGVTYHIMAGTSFPNTGGGTLVLSVAAVPPPPNDEFDNATPIDAVPFSSTVDTSGATTAPDDPSLCGGARHSMWYSLTPSVDETVFAAESAGSNYSTVAVYVGARGSLRQVACGDAASPAAWPATAGVTYHIMVESEDAYGGSVTLQVSAALVPPNDDFDRASVITNVPFTDNLNVTGASPAADDPTGCGGTANSVWYSFTPSVSETFITDISGSNYLAGVSVYTGSEGSLTQVACHTRPVSTPTKWAATAGITYHLMVTNFFPPSTINNEQLALRLAGATPPANDDFNHATVVSAMPFTVNIDATGATAAADDPAGCGSTDSSVWFDLTPSVDEAIVLEYSGTYPSIVSAYTGSRGSLTTVTCGPYNPTTFQATAGVTYHIMVANSEYVGAAGQLTLNIRAILPPANNDLSHATVITSLPFAADVDTTAATAAPNDPTCVWPPSATVWYKFAAPATGTIQLNSNGSSYTSSVSAYTAAPGALIQVACGAETTAPFAVTKGVTYYFMVSSFAPQSGGSLHFAVTAFPDLPATSACTTTLTGKVSGTVTVASGTTCITNANVYGAVLVRPGAQLLATNSTLGGALSADGAAAVAICGSSITGSVMVRGSTGLVLIGDGNDHSGACGGNRIGGSVLIGGSAKDANRSGIELGGNTIAGQVLVTGNQTDPATVLAADDATIEIEGNHIGAGLNCTGNAPTPVNEGLLNTVRAGRAGQCAAL